MKLLAFISLDSGSSSLVTKSWAKSVGIDTLFLETTRSKTCRFEFELVSNPPILVQYSLLARPLTASCISPSGITFSFSKTDIWLLKNADQTCLLESDYGGAFLFVPMSNIVGITLLNPVDDEWTTSSPKTYASVLRNCLLRDFSPSIRFPDSVGHISLGPSCLCF